MVNRFALVCLGLLSIAGCNGVDGFVCDPSVSVNQCVHLDGRYAQCIAPFNRCAVPAPDCPSGWRFDENAGERAGRCVEFPPGIEPPPNKDPNAGRDMGSEDLAIDMPDMTVDTGDMPIVVTVPDLAGAPPGTWSTATVSGAPFLLGVWGTSATDVYVTGAGLGSNASVLHSTGNGAWVPQATTPAEQCSYVAMWGSGQSNIYAAGSCHAPSVSDGAGTWMNNQTIPGGIGVQWQGLWGSSNSDVYTCGSQAYILHSTGNGSWEKQTGGGNTLPTLLGLWGSSATNIYAVGLSGTIWHSAGGGTWDTTGQKSGTTANLLGLYGKSDGSVIYAVGGDGATSVILRSTGDGNWAPQTITPATSVYLRSVWMTADANEVFVVGDGGTILHSVGGGAFTVQPTKPTTTANLQHIWGSGLKDIYAVGASGTILHYQ